MKFFNTLLTFTLIVGFVSQYSAFATEEPHFHGSFVNKNGKKITYEGVKLQGYCDAKILRYSDGDELVGVECTSPDGAKMLISTPLDKTVLFTPDGKEVK